ncbi:g9131 [Coccomyxa elongata]
MHCVTFEHLGWPQSGSFPCLDGLKTIAYEHVNDNYCDCFDGSDEPGSSACVNGQFYCANKGYTPQHLNASMVDDTFCDCCDGSDEQPGVCKNTCAEAGAAARAALKERAEAEAAGALLKEKYLAQAQETRATWAQEEARLAKSIAEQQGLVDRWKVKHDAVLEQERRQKEKEEAVARKEAERLAQTPVHTPGDDGTTSAAAIVPDVTAPEEPAADHVTTTEAPNTGSESAMDAAEAVLKAAKEAAAEGTAQALNSAPGTDVTPPEEPAADHITATEPANADAKSALEMAAEASHAMNPHEAAKQQEQQQQEQEQAETAEERARRVAAQWIREESTDAPVEEPQEAEEAAGIIEDEAVEEAAAAEEAEEPPAEVVVPKEMLGLGDRFRRAVKAFVRFVPWGPTDPISDAQTIKDKYWKHHNALAELERQQSELRSKLKLDYGPGGEFLALHGKCFEADVDKYVYEICPYKNAAQKDGAAHVSLGTWQGFRDNYTAMAFTGGQHCWNGPQRSMLVTISCGKVEHLKHVEEPSRCEYQAHLTTPAACSSEAARQLQLEVEEAERAIRSHDEL